MKRNSFNNVWTKIKIGEKDECWPFMGSLTKDGYGQIGVNGKVLLAHRVVFELVNLSRPNICRHVCDNPKCCNPQHLINGTVKDNAQDMVKRGRSTKGEKNPMSKITQVTVNKIRARKKEGVSTRKIAEEFALKTHHVYKIINFMIWK